jgi:dethiobiotin synthetase
VRGLFVTGTDTGVGKTVLGAAVLAAMAAAGEQVAARKPVLTGVSEPPGEWPPDDELLAVACGAAPGDVTPPHLRFGLAAAPHLAAGAEERTIDPQDVVAGARAAGAGDRTVVVEGIGGLLVPITEQWCVRDLAVALGLPVVIAARPGLGTINHTLLTVEAARSAGLEVAAVVLTPWPQDPDQLERSNLSTIARIGDVDVRTLTRVSRPDRRSLAQAGSTLPWREWVARARHGD